jgi:hypothetical protein
MPNTNPADRDDAADNYKIASSTCAPKLTMA